MNKKPQRTKNRGHRENRGTFGKWLFLITVGLFTLFIVRFAYIAINKDVQHVNLRSQAEQIYTQQRIIQARRGDIYDSEGNPLATDTSKYTLYAVLDRTQKSSDGKPLYVKDRKKTAKVLSQYIDLTPKQIEKILKPKLNLEMLEATFLFQQCRRSRTGTCQELILLRLQHVNIQKANLLLK